MDFTELYPSSLPPVFSPGSTFLASTFSSSPSSPQTILIRHSTTLQTVQSFRIPSLPPSHSSSLSPSASLSGSSRNRRPLDQSSAPSSSTSAFPPEITHIAFSPDSARILAFCSKRSVAFVFTLGGVGELGGEDDEAVEAVLEGGVEGLVRVEWSRTGNRLLGWSELGLRLTIWDLDDPIRDRRFFIQNFKPLPSGNGHTWSSDHRFFYLAERHLSKDSVGIYDTMDSWKLVHRVPTHTVSLQGISLSPNNTHLAVWDHSLEFKLHILLPPLTKPLHTLPPPPSQAKLESLGDDAEGGEEWDDTGLGVRCVAWHPDGVRLAVGGWDGKIRILNDHPSWTVTNTILPMRLAPAGTSVWKEPSDWAGESGGTGIVQYHSISTPATIPFLRPDPKRPPPKMGVCHLEFNYDGTILMSRQENSPSSLFLHPFPSPPTTTSTSSLSNPLLPPPPPPTTTILIQTYPITSASFHPSNPKKLALSTGQNGLFMWNGDWVDDDGKEGVAECIGVPSNPFLVSSLTWSPTGSGLLLFDSSQLRAKTSYEGQFALVFEVLDDDSDPDQANEEGMAGMSLIQEGDEGDEDWSVRSEEEESEGSEGEGEGERRGGKQGQGELRLADLTGFSA